MDGAVSGHPAAPPGPPPGPPGPPPGPPPTPPVDGGASMQSLVGGMSESPGLPQAVPPLPQAMPQMMQHSMPQTMPAAEPPRPADPEGEARRLEAAKRVALEIQASLNDPKPIP